MEKKSALKLENSIRNCTGKQEEEKPEKKKEEKQKKQNPKNLKIVKFRKWCVKFHC